MKKKECQNCKFFHEYSESLRMFTEDEGECRVNSPTVNPDLHGSGQWPQVSKKDWCGKFEQKAN